MKLRQWFITTLLIGGVLLTGCSFQNTTPTASPSSETTTAQSSPTPSPVTSASPTIAGLPRLEGEATVEMVVKGSTITLQLDGNNAPITAGNFVDLVNQGVYNGLAFHRVVRQPEPFVVQGGDPQSKDPNFPIAQLGTGGYTDPTTNAERYVPLEIKPEGATEPVYSQPISAPPELKHQRGAVAMARSQFPDSASSQFYFALADLPFLDGSYAVFGYVTDGMDVVDQIQQGDRIESARVTAGLENLQAAE